MGNAARIYFDEAPGRLSTSQLAYLVGIVIAPSAFQLLEPAQKRRNFVLSEALEAGLISESEYDAAIAEPLAIPDPSQRCDEPTPNNQ